MLMLCEMIKRDRHITYREIQTFLGIDMKAIHTILHDHLSETLQSLDPTQFDRSSKTGSCQMEQRNAQEIQPRSVKFGLQHRYWGRNMDLFV